MTDTAKIDTVAFESTPRETGREIEHEKHPGDPGPSKGVVSNESAVPAPNTALREARAREVSAHAAKEREELQGMIEKKTYIGLVSAHRRERDPADAQVQAFSVAMKHSLRGEKGPFYSDLYSLIAFLPKCVGMASRAHS